MDMPGMLEDPEKTKALLEGMEKQLLGVHVGTGKTFAEGNKLAAKSLEEITSGDYRKRMRALGAEGTAAFTAMEVTIKGMWVKPT